MTETVAKLNISERGYLRIPYSLFKQPLFGAGSRMFTRAEIALSGLIYGLSQRKGKEDASCKMSYTTFEQKLHISRGTVARAVHALKSSGKIVQDKSHKTCASYRFAEKSHEKGYITIDLYLYNTKFEIRGEDDPRYLTQAEIQVLSLIKTHCQNPKGTGKFTGSVRGISKTLGLSKNCVQNCLFALLRAGLIFRAQNMKGVNGHKRSEYKINEKLLRNLSKGYQKATESASDKPAKKLTEKEQAADKITDREHYYAVLRQQAIDRADAFKARAERDEVFRTVTQELGKLPPKMGRAAVFGSAAELEELQRKEQQLKAQKAKRLALLGLSEDDLRPHWHCPLCEDKGYIEESGQACSCYPEHGRRRT